MRRAGISRAFFYVTAATASAVGSDWLIESVARAGLWGHRYGSDDPNNLACTAIAAAMLVVVVALARAVAGSNDATSVRRDWLAEAAHDLARRSSRRAFAPTLVVALAVRYGMESVAGVARDGHAVAGLGWLGGPALLALAVHAALCAGALIALLAIMRWLDRAVGRVVRLVLAWIATAAARPGAWSVARDAARPNGRDARLERHRGERAPPLRPIPLGI